MSFDPSTYLDTTMTSTLDTSLPPCPEGTWLFECMKVDARANPEHDNNAAAAPLILEYSWECRDENCLVLAERNKVTVRQGIFVTLNGNTIEAGDGKNTQLGALRAAVGQNT